MKIEKGYVVGTRWRFDDTQQWSEWVWNIASGCTGLTMIYKSSSTASRHNKFGIEKRKEFGYFVRDDHRQPNDSYTDSWRPEEAEFEVKLFPATLNVEGI